MNTVNVAIVGYGLAGATFHAPLVKVTEGLKIKYIVARSEEKQTKARNDHPSAEIVSDLESLLKQSKDIGLAVIATPNKEHAPQAMACLNAGIPVVVDKPMALNSAQCAELIDLSQRKGTLLSVFQNRRWDNDFLTLKQLLAKETLGKILRFESRYERYRPALRPNAWREQLDTEQGGGILFDLGSHLIDQATQLFGQPDQVYAEVKKRRDGVAADDDAFVALSFPSGVQAHLWMSALSASLGHRFRLLGTEGAYEKYGLDPQEDDLRAGKTPKDSNWGIEKHSSWGNITLHKDGLNIKGELETAPGAYQRFYELMREAINGSGAVPVDPVSAMNTMKIIEQARKSSGSTIKL
jgi:scyllo-inositol 2-dehydrogenase (NADP+)